MSEIPTRSTTGPKVWHLALPDWGVLDTVWERRLPFALWQVGEQALLFHWLDAAVNQGSEKVVIHAADRPSDVRKAIESATLWPIEIEVVSAASIGDLQVDDTVDRLPQTVGLNSSPDAGWGLIKHWNKLEQQWLINYAEETKDYGKFAAIGRSCEIASDATFVAPFWIGSHVSIGPGSTIGPGTVIEDGCIIAGNSLMERSHLAAHTYLGPETDLVECVLHRNNLLSLKNEAYVRGLEGFLAGSLHADDAKTNRSGASLRERLWAAQLLWRWRSNSKKSEASFTGIDGQVWPQLEDRSIANRGPWLKLVIQGKMALFGVTPRDAAALENLPDEWQSILRKAPVGVFSYADVMGASEPGDVEEALHCMYQVTGNQQNCLQLCQKWLLDIQNKPTK